VITSMSMKTWESFSEAEQQQLQEMITAELETPVWQVTAEETIAGVDCLTGKQCAHGEPNNLTLVPISDNDLQRAQQVLVENVLPAWAAKVSPADVAQWNETAGKQANIQIK
jgi:hypothetical protein